MTPYKWHLIRNSSTGCERMSGVVGGRRDLGRTEFASRRRPQRKRSSATRDVYLIGYRAADEVIFDLLAATTPQKTTLHVVSATPQDAREIMARVLGQSPQLVIGRTCGDGFSQFIDVYPA